MKNYKIDFTTATLTITKDFEEKLMNPLSEERRIFTEMRELFPNLRLVRRTHKSASNSSKGLTYARMEKYISCFEDGAPYLLEFVKVKDYSKSKKDSYGEVKKWFLETFPDYYEGTPNIIDGKMYINPPTSNISSLPSNVA